VAGSSTVCCACNVSDIQPTKPGHRAPNRLPAERLAAQVARDPKRAHSALLDQPHGLPRVSVLVQIDERDVRPFLGEGECHGPANAAIASGDERDRTAELPGSLCGGIRRARPRRHPRLDARLVSLALGRPHDSLRRRLLRHQPLLVGSIGPNGPSAS
jgi:hypothetical protein